MLKKTASTILSIIVLLLLVGAFFFRDKLLPKPVVSNVASQTTHIFLDGQDISVSVAVTPMERAQGLSGSESLGSQEGMLFVFDMPDTYKFWMKEMNYPIDIIWLDADKKIVDIKKNADPSSYPERFAPIAPALYVLEVPTGFSETYGLKAGDQAQFSL